MDILELIDDIDFALLGHFWPLTALSALLIAIVLVERGLIDNDPRRRG